MKEKMAGKHYNESMQHEKAESKGSSMMYKKSHRGK